MPPTTLASAPSIPATTTTASASASIGCTAARRCRPATPTSATISVSAPSIEAVSSASSATPRSEVPAVTMSTTPAAGGVVGGRAAHPALGGWRCPRSGDPPSPGPFDALDRAAGRGRAHHVDVLGRGPRHEDRALVDRQEPLDDRADLPGRLALGGDDLAGPLAELAVMVDLREPEVAERQVPQVARAIAGGHLNRGRAG